MKKILIILGHQANIDELLFIEKILKSCAIKIENADLFSDCKTIDVQSLIATTVFEQRHSLIIGFGVKLIDFDFNKYEAYRYLNVAFIEADPIWHLIDEVDLKKKLWSALSAILPLITNSVKLSSTIKITK